MTENLNTDAQVLASTFEKINRTLTQMNKSLKDFGTNLKKVNTAGGGTSGSGGTGAGNNVPLGTDNAMISQGALGKVATGLKVVGAVAQGIQTALPNMGSTLDRASGYYRAGIQSAYGNRALMEQTTLRGMGNGLTSAGSDANVANILTQSGIMYSNKRNSTYMQNVRNVSNTAQLYGIDNESAAASLAGLTSGPTSGMLMSTQGIMTSEAGTGKQLTEQQIFEQFYQRATAGRGKATVEETMDSLHRGFLGQTIANSGLDEIGQKKLAQYFIGKAQGQTIDLSNNTTTQKLLDENAKNGNANPMRGVYKQNQVDTRQMGKSESGFISGLEAAVNILESFNDVVGSLVSNFASLSGFISTAGNMSAVRGTMQTIQGVAGAMDQGGGTPIGMQTSSLRGGGSVSSSYFGTGGGGTGNSGSVSSTSSGGASTSNGRLRMVHPVPGAGKGTRWNVKDKDHPNGHNGIDYKVKVGTSVRAAADGTVIVAGGDGANTYKSGKNTLGIQVQIDHGNNVVSIYGHLSSTSVGLGPIKQGAIIGASGNSGFSSGPHLHFQVNENGTDVNPEKYLGASNADSTSTSGTNDAGSASNSTNPLSTSTPSGVVSADISGVSSSSTSVVDSLNGYSAPSSPFSGGGDPAGVARTAGNISGYTGSSGYNEAGMAGNPLGAKYKNNVTINLTIAQASDSEAHAFANRVKKILEQDTLMTNMGRF